MRFAPPNPLRIADRASGLNAISVRSYNERLVLSLLLQNEGTSRMEIGEKTGLSAQTVSVIIRSLEQEGLVAKGEAQRGRVGPPTIPLSLNSEGAYSVGVSVGHRQTEVVLIDFIGHVRFHTTLPNPKPAQSGNHSRFLQTIRDAIAVLPKNTRGRIAGIGLALPEDRNELECVTTEAERRFKALQEEIEAEIGLPVFVQNDITSAAGGESMFGAAKHLTDYLFCYLGARLHSRLVLNHQIYNSNSSFSYDVGLSNLEEMVRAQGLSTDELWERGALWPDYGALYDTWRTACRDQLRESVESLGQFVEVKTVVLSSYAPPLVCQQICDALSQVIPEITAIAGMVEVAPKAVGAASLPFSSRFMVQ